MDALPKAIPVEHETSQLWMVSQVAQNQKASLDALQADVKVLRAENGELKETIAELKYLLLKMRNVPTARTLDDMTNLLVKIRNVPIAPIGGDDTAATKQTASTKEWLPALVESWGFRVMSAAQKQALKNRQQFNDPYAKVDYETAISNLMPVSCNPSSFKIGTYVLKALVDWDCEYNDRCLMPACHDVNFNRPRSHPSPYTNWLLCMVIRSGDIALFLHVMDVYSDLLDSRMFLKLASFGSCESSSQRSWLMHVFDQFVDKHMSKTKMEELIQIAETLYNKHGARLGMMGSHIEERQSVHNSLDKNGDHVPVELIARARVLLNQ